MRISHFIQASVVLFSLSVSGDYVCAQTSAPLAQNTIDCSAFTKRQGGWYVGPRTTFDIGNAKGVTMFGVLITRYLFIVGGADLYETLEQKCGGSRILKTDTLAVPRHEKRKGRTKR